MRWCGSLRISFSRFWMFILVPWECLPSPWPSVCLAELLSGQRAVPWTPWVVPQCWALLHQTSLCPISHLLKETEALSVNILAFPGLGNRDMTQHLLSIWVVLQGIRHPVSQADCRWINTKWEPTNMQQSECLWTVIKALIGDYGNQYKIPDTKKTNWVIACLQQDAVGVKTYNCTLWFS